MVGITIEYTGLIPSEITTLGIKFGAANQTALLFILATVVFYFLLAFVVYAAADFLAWRLAIGKQNVESEEERRERRVESEKEWLRLRDDIKRKIEETGTRWGDVYNEVSSIARDKKKEMQSIPIMELRDFPEMAQEEMLIYFLLGEDKGPEAFGAIAWLRNQGEEAAATDIYAAVREHVARLQKTYEEEIGQFSFLFAPRDDRPSPTTYLTDPVIRIRAIFDFILPIVVSAYAIGVLVF